MDKIIDKAKTPIILALLLIIAIGQASVFQQARIAQEFKMNWQTAKEGLERANAKNLVLQAEFDKAKQVAEESIVLANDAINLNKPAMKGWAACRAELEGRK